MTRSTYDMVRPVNLAMNTVFFGLHKPVPHMTISTDALRLRQVRCNNFDRSPKAGIGMTAVVIVADADVEVRSNGVDSGMLVGMDE